MNERIKVLAQNAGLISHFNAAPHRPDIEKFAELLISAVIAEVRDEVQYQFDWTLADIVTEQVKKEFGVK